MQGRQLTQMPLFVDGNIGRFVPQNHLLRKVDKALDLSFIHKLTKSKYCQNNGRPSLDPVVFFKMQIIAYLYGIPSDRRLCEEIQCNMAYRWYLGYPLDEDTPDHSTLTRTRDRLGEEVFQKVFEKVVRECQKVGLVQGKQIISDASLIKADASKKSLKPKETNGEETSAGSDDGAPKGGSGAQETGTSASGQSTKNGESSAQKGRKNGKSSSSKRSRKNKSTTNKTHQSKTDPDSTCVNRAGYNGELHHKLHCSIDGKSRIITDCYITTGALHECKVLTGRIKHQKRKFKLPILELLADSGYGHGPTYEFLKNKGIRGYIPLRDEKLGNGKNGPTDGFTYDRRHDRYKCPQGHFLYPHKPSDSMTRYRVTGGHCRGCPLREQCFPNPNVNHPRYINRSHYQDEFDAVRRRMGTKTFTKKVRERSWKIEGIFGEGKTKHGLNRARYRGRAKVQIQVYMAAMAMNLKRLAARRGLICFFKNIVLWEHMKRLLAENRLSHPIFPQLQFGFLPTRFALAG